MYEDVDIGHDLKMAFEDGYQAGVEAAQPKWTSVQERLPEKPCSVLVSVHGIILKGWYEDGSFEMISGYKFNAYDSNCVVCILDSDSTATEGVIVWNKRNC